ncbi:MAG: hypothetical protein HY717_07075 [Planctomycetes bacterium]|nr:hypothetical protein [Planctomycetota bacterium]
MMKSSLKILYAITGHGYGHATRSMVIARALLKSFPGMELVLSTSIPAGILKSFVPLENFVLPVRARDYEPGTVQRNCFEVDGPATRAAYGRFFEERERRIADEARYLAEAKCSGVISDVAAVPVVAAARAGLPAVVVSNFTWDWILKPVFAGDTGLEEELGRLAADYAKARRYLRLPFHPREHPFAAVEDLPLIGRRGRLRREEVFRRLGLEIADPRPVVLVAAGGWQAEGWPAIQVQGCEEYRFLLVGDLPVHSRAQTRFLPFHFTPDLAFPDVVRAVEAGIVKPGYGTCAEFALNRTAMVGIERRGFREYEVLVEAMAGLLPYQGLTLEDFFSGNWQPALQAVLEKPFPPLPWKGDGARAAAARLVEILGGGG